MKKFFEELSTMMADKDQIKLTIAKTGEELTIMITGKGKIINASGTAEEMDEKLLPAFQQELASKSFTFSVSETESSDDDKEEEAEQEKEKVVAKGIAPPKKKEVAKAPAKKVAPKKEEESVKEEEADVVVEAKEDEVQVDDKAEAQNKLRVFKDAMSRGAELYKNKKYPEAQIAYQQALTIFPEDKEAIKEQANVVKWVKALAEL